MSKESLITRLNGAGLIPVIAIDDANKAGKLGKAILDSGIDVAEITFRTAEGEDAIKKMTTAFPEMLIGAGTVLNVDTCKKAIGAGAKFIVTPAFEEEIVKYCLENDVLCIPGVSSATEILKCYNMGINVVKLFPAEDLGGIKYINSIGAALPVKFVPTGGININNIADYAKNEKVLAVGGTWVVKKEYIEKEDYALITKLCKEAVNVLLGYKVVHIGINAENQEIAGNYANEFGEILYQDTKVGNSSTFVGTMIECMHNTNYGQNGHIAIGTNSVERAIYYMSKKNVTFDESTIKKNKNGNIEIIYLNNEIGGFRMHLKKVK